VEDYLFDDIDYTISAGDKVEAEIRVSFNSIADTGVTAGDTLQVDINEGQTDQSAFWSVKDETGEINWDISLHAEAKRLFILEWRDEKHFIPRKI